MVYDTCLKEVADIYTGYTFRSKLVSERDGNVSIIPLCSLKEDGCIDMEGVVSIRMDVDSLKAHFWLRKGDVLLKARGKPQTVVLIEEDLPQTICANSVTLIRAKSDVLIPGYLAWFLDQAALPVVTRSIEMVNKKDLKDLSIRIPDIEMQKNIAALYSLMIGERIAAKKLLQKRTSLLRLSIRLRLGLS